jgi:signal transduction histidine kinase
MTAHQDALKHQEAMAAGFTATNTKPLSTEKAVELLKSYPAQGIVMPSKAEGYPVIDLALGMQRASVLTENQAIEILNILQGTLQVDIPLLQRAEKHNDSEGAKAILLKMRGALCYAGTPRLEKACEALSKELENGTQDCRKIDMLFSLLYDEAKLFADHFKEFIKGVNAEKEAEHLKMMNEEQKTLLAQEAKFMKIANQVAHDIRSPLSSLLTVVKSCTHIPEAERITLREAAIGIGDIANHLLHQYRNKDSDNPVEHEERLSVLVSTILMESLSIKKHQYESSPIQFDGTIDANAHFAFIKIQGSSFKRLLSNLMNNAADAFEDKSGTVQVHLEADNEWVTIRIQDSGKGMSAELIDKILLKTAVTQGKESGHGLNLLDL